jgi:hypothetical protein
MPKMKERMATTVKAIIIQVGSRFISMVHPLGNRHAPIPRFPARIWPNRFVLLIGMIGIRATCSADSLFPEPEAPA